MTLREARELRDDWAYGSAVVRKYDPCFPLAELAAYVASRILDHLCRLLIWSAVLAAVVAAAAESVGWPRHAEVSVRSQRWVQELVLACPRTGPPALVAVPGVPVTDP
jgi:hypothetical protein